MRTIITKRGGVLVCAGVVIAALISCGFPTATESRETSNEPPLESASQDSVPTDPSSGSGGSFENENSASSDSSMDPDSEESTEDSFENDGSVEDTVNIDPDSSGPYRVFIEDGVAVPGADGRMTEVRICSPSETGESRIANDRFPLILIFPGFQLERSQYASYCDFFASWGFVTMTTTYSESGFGIDHDHLANDVSPMIDWAVSAQESISESIDASAIGVGGHSLGGKIAIMAAGLDPRIGVVLGWDPVEGMGPTVIPERVQAIEAPMLLIGETLDAEGFFQACAPEDGNYARFFEAAPNIALQVTLNGADHMDWVDDPSCFVCRLCKSGELDDARVKAFTRRTSVAFARRYLMDDESMDRYLVGSIMDEDEAAGLVSIQAKGL